MEWGWVVLLCLVAMKVVWKAAEVVERMDEEWVVQRVDELVDWKAGDMVGWKAVLKAWIQ